MKKTTLLLALGNDLLADDGIGLAAAREIAREAPPGVAVEETGEAGLALVELMMGYDNAVLLDAIMTGDHEPGTVIELGPADFRRVVAPSPHYAGLPEVIDLAARLEVPFPTRIRVLAMEVENPHEIGAPMTPRVAAALPAYVARARACLAELSME